ncbi:hypothetical protein B0J14DRAFT_252426 [Halenospora varia]|nr:hypothetical protein B0J14DRAFT_252426 [Halenospora varia]
MASFSASSTSPSEEVLALAFAGQENFVPAAEEAQMDLPHTFLSLAPTVSASYPLSPKTRSAMASDASPPAQTSDDVQIEQTSAPAQTGTPAEPEVNQGIKSRRSSSMSSVGSNGQSPSQRRRFLRLGPVHYGEDKDGLGDWSEVAILE